jgi:PUA-like domain
MMLSRGVLFMLVACVRAAPIRQFSRARCALCAFATPPPHTTTRASSTRSSSSSRRNISSSALQAAPHTATSASTSISSSSSSSTSSSSGSSLPSVTIAKGKARLFWDGNPLVFGGAVASVQGKPGPCDIVEVKADTGKLMAWGVFNADSMFRVRILAFASEPLGATRDIGEVVEARVKTAIAARAAVGLPSDSTDAYRCVNGEGDRLSGLVIDVYAKTVGVSSSALWAEAHRETIEAAIGRAFGADYNIIWRLSDGRLQQDGWVNPSASSSSSSAADVDNVDDDSTEATDAAVAVLKKELPPPTEIKEWGIKYLVQPQVGQKTVRSLYTESLLQ